MGVVSPCSGFSLLWFLWFSPSPQGKHTHRKEDEGQYQDISGYWAWPPAKANVHSKKPMYTAKGQCTQQKANVHSKSPNVHNKSPQCTQQTPPMYTAKPKMHSKTPQDVQQDLNLRSGTALANALGLGSCFGSFVVFLPCLPSALGGCLACLLSFSPVPPQPVLVHLQPFPEIINHKSEI